MRNISMTDVQKRIEYVVKHDPIRYFVKRRWLLFWTVETIDGKCADLFILKPSALAICELLNSAYQLGYTTGQQTIINAIFK